MERHPLEKRRTYLQRQLLETEKHMDRHPVERRAYLQAQLLETRKQMDRQSVERRRVYLHIETTSRDRETDG